jgi:DNA-binding transcriptional ArsR family regulator
MSRARTTTGEVFKALADPTRRAILASLLQGEQPANGIALHFPVSRPAISRHLRVLRKADLVVETREGRNRMYRLNAKPLKDIDEWLSAYRRMWKVELQNLKRYLENHPKGR